MGTRNDSVTSIGTTAVVVSPAQPGRVSFFLKNISATQDITVCISDGQLAVATKGVVLNPGDVLSDSDTLGYACNRESISVISSAAGGALAVQIRTVD